MLADCLVLYIHRMREEEQREERRREGGRIEGGEIEGGRRGERGRKGVRQ